MAYQFIIASKQVRHDSYRDTAQCGDYSETSAINCAARKLARALVTAGYENGPIEARGTDGKLRYTVKSLHAFAKFTLQEMEVKRWQAFPYEMTREGRRESLKTKLD